MGSFVLAAVFHANLDQRPIFDTLWMFSLFVGALAILPQLRLTIRNPANVPAGMNHFVAAMAFSCILRGGFFWYAFEDFTSKSYFTSMIKFNLSGHAALTAHVVQFLLLVGYWFDFQEVFLVKNLETQALRPQQGPFLQQEV